MFGLAVPNGTQLKPCTQKVNSMLYEMILSWKTILENFNDRALLRSASLHGMLIYFLAIIESVVHDINH
jgi:hypothetical protein